jgi:hypothetical protein
MHRIALMLQVLLLFAPADVYAGCSPSLRGQSAKISIAISDCDSAAMMIQIDDFAPTADGGVPRQAVPFTSQCVLSKSGLACHSRGSTPLAGSMYRYTNDTNPSCDGRRPGVRLTCTKGCRAVLPKYLYIEPYEC